MHHRLHNLRDLMREREVAALLITAAANRRYISGFSGSFGALLVSADAALIFTDSRYRLRAAHEAPAFALREITPDMPLPRLVAAAAAELGLTQIGFEAAHISVAAHTTLNNALRKQAGAAPPPELQPVEGLVETLREVKDAAELALLRRAIAVTDAAFAAVAPHLHPEMTEREAAWRLEAAMREGGADGLAFPIIVAAGPNAAAPHAIPGAAPLGAGRPIIIDMGARLDGYHADMTRTIVLGEPDGQFRAIYTVVLEAQQHAIAGLRAGLTGAEADALARECIAAAGYGDRFGHGTGHGVGLDIHEGPSLRRRPSHQPDAPDTTPRLRAGNVTSVEPGIYLEGWGGVRIEDLVLIGETGCEVLTGTPKLHLA